MNGYKSSFFYGRTDSLQTKEKNWLSRIDENVNFNTKLMSRQLESRQSLVIRRDSFFLRIESDGGKIMFKKNETSDEPIWTSLFTIRWGNILAPFR